MPRSPAAASGFPSVTGLPARLSPPSDLTLDERQIFVDLVASCRPEHFRASDLPLLSAYVRAIGLERASAVEAPHDDKAAARWEKATKAMVALSMRLRLSPQSRAPNTPGRPGGKPERPLSYYEVMALKEQGDDGAA